MIENSIASTESLRSTALKQGPTGPMRSVSAEMGRSSQSLLSLKKIVIGIKVKYYFWLYSPKDWKYRMIGQLASCDDSHPRTSLALPPYKIITQSYTFIWTYFCVGIQTGALTGIFQGVDPESEKFSILVS
ncbi:hypothetical protein TNCV_5045061 [Trichonephila clavipes]|uniref:Uncharacterized protein n=1 Tax=Trichonephila clavipes TaxID=2585209 RepID=A0A8X7BKC2_TRICX|nr:hypothetical protein TNCV_5045061 [Trichonephila clavipes]